MALTPVRKMDLGLHGQDASVVASLIALGAIDNSKISATAEIEDTKLATITAAGKVANSATSATDANVADTIIARDADGGFSAGDVILSALTVNGDLTVNGTTTSVNSVDLVVNDRLVHLNEPATAGADDPVPTGLSGLSVHRGSVAGAEREHAGLVWEEGAQKFVMQMLDQDAAGSTKLDLEIKNLQAREGNFQINANGINTEIRLENNLVRFDLDDGANATWVDISNDTFHVERTNDTYNTYSQFDINHDGVELRDANGDAMLPTLDQHLVVKKYVDDADVLKFDKAGGAIDADGTIQLSVTDTASAVLGGQTLSFAADHTTGFGPDVNATTVFGLDEISMLYADDAQGSSFQAAIASGSLNVMGNDGAGGEYTFDANAVFSYSSTLGGKSGLLSLNMDPTDPKIALRMGDQLVGANPAEAAVMEVRQDGIKLVTRDLQAASNSQPSDTVLLPTDDAHLVVKKYVDDADTEILDKSGIVVGTQNTYSSTAVVANGDSLVTAIGKLDESVAEVAGKSYHEAYIYEAAGGETSLAAPVGAPAIPDSAFTEVYIDGRKVFRGADKQFTVAVGGGSIEFAALTEGQTVELRYFA